MKHNKVKNPKWQEANQLAMYNHAREDELGYDRETNPSRGQGGLEKGPNWGEWTLAFAT